MKPNEIKCLVKLVATNDASGLLLLRQHESELAFTFPLLTSEWDPFWESARKYYILCIRKAEETSAFYMQTVTKEECSYENRF